MAEKVSLKKLLIKILEWAKRFTLIQQNAGLWIEARDNSSIVRSGVPTTQAGFAPIIDMKTDSGDWSIGTLGETFCISYALDSNYNTNPRTNNQTASMKLDNSSVTFNGLNPFNSTNQTTGTLPGDRLPLMVKVVSATSAAFTVNASAGYAKDITLTIPSGYELVGCVGVTTSHGQACQLGRFNKTSSTTIRVEGKNTSGSNFTDMTVTAYGLCVLSNIF